MKKIIFAAVALSAISTPALAQVKAVGSTTGTIAIAGEVPSFCDLTVSTNGNAGKLDIKVADQGKTATVGGMNLHCNSATGFKVVPTTANNFRLISPATTNAVSYKLRADGQAGPSEMPAGSGLVYGAYENNKAATTAAGFNSNVYLDVLNSTDARYAGTYSDTITLTISAN